MKSTSYRLITDEYNKQWRIKQIMKNIKLNMAIQPGSKSLRLHIKLAHLLFLVQILMIIIPSNYAQLNLRRQARQQDNNVVAEMQVVCQSDSIVLMVNTNTPFNGMLYARDAASNPDCFEEIHASTNMSLKLPLRACGTLSAEVDDGVEFFNTIVIQPHMRLMTNQGKGYNIRCKYQTRERTIANNHFNVSAAFQTHNGPQTSTLPLLATASMPTCTMKIFRIDQDNVAESVKVGDKLVMVIEIDKQDMYGMRVTNCVVRDGLNKAEQQLINDSGCPTDEGIMPKFEYENNNTRAAVAFRAHKFPHTSSIYYQCNVRLCINGGGCEPINCPVSGSVSSSGGVNATNELTGGESNFGRGGPRLKRFIGHRIGEANHERGNGEMEPSMNELPLPGELKAEPKQSSDMSFDVYSGLYVSDDDMSVSNSGDTDGQRAMPARRSQNSSGGGQADNLAGGCLTLGKVGLLVLLSTLISIGLVVLIACQIGLITTNGGADEDLESRKRQQTARSARRVPSVGSSGYPASNFNMRPSTSSSGRSLSSFYQFE